MKRPEDDIVDALSRVARRAPVPEMSPEKVASIASIAAQHAVRGAQPDRVQPDRAQPDRAQRERRPDAWTTRHRVAVAAAAIVGFGASIAWGLVAPGDPHASSTDSTPAGAPVAASSAPRVTTLLAGDQLVESEGSELEVVADDGSRRRVRLTRGEVLFDVAPLADGDQFEVITPHRRISVRGTIFSVHVSERATSVHVYEGTVSVDDDLLHEGGRLGASASSPALGEEARRRVRRRHRAAMDPLEPTTEPEATAETIAAGATAATSPAPGSARRRGARGSRVVAARELAVARTEVASQGATPQDAREWIAASDASRALDAARRTRARAAGSPEWSWVEADALRALGRDAEAADRLEALAVELRGAEAARAGFVAASVRFHRLSDPRGALAALERFGCVDDAVLGERALALRVRILRAAGRLDEAEGDARRYLDRFPAGGQRVLMERLRR